MKFVSIGSGSKGNATIISNSKTTVMIDCGFSGKETIARLKEKGLTPQDLDAILVTHEHSDHSKGVATLSRQYAIPIYMTHGTARGMKLLKYQYTKVSAGSSFEIGDFSIDPICVPHDSNEATQFIINNNNKRFGILTDLGHITPHIQKAYEHCDSILLEFNHDITLLEKGPYPYSLKKRVGGNLGHLNNQQAASMLKSMNLKRLKNLALSHISDKNNCSKLALEIAQKITENTKINIHTLEQQFGSNWITVTD
ncbi:MAG: MBL fold metallo-hydrolase [Saccharospirillaceae bacterium]|nr:MBL fold metallo-hydrolase [Pseudomonadales bacterium]NRB80752.1 MBL fold metallo-hydrolase [Saccharospirillaceae bacterium]